MKFFRVHILLVLLIACSHIGVAMQGADRRAGYVTHMERIHELERDLQRTRGTNRDEILNALARKHFEQAELYYVISRAMAGIGEIYYAIMEEQNIDAGIASGLYRGIGQFELGNYVQAENTLNNFLRRGDNIPGDLRNSGIAWLGAAKYALGNKHRAGEEWQTIQRSVREKCSVAAYVYARVGYNVGDLIDRCAINENSDNRENIIPAMQVMIAAGRFEPLVEFVKKDAFDIAYISNEGSDKELRYFNPSDIVTLSQAHYALAVHYADKLSGNTEKRFYRGVFYFRTGRYENAVDILVGIDDIRSAVYLGGAYYNTGQKEFAREIFDYVEKSAGDDVLGELYIMYGRLGIDENKKKAVDFFQQKIEERQRRSRRDIPQDLYTRLGLMYFYYNDYTAVQETLGAAFRTEWRSDLRVNDPAFMVLFGSSIVLAKNFISLSEAIDIFSTVARAYQPANGLVETTSLIDVATNIGREGRVIYRR